MLRKNLFLLFFVFIITFLTYANTLKNSFVHDDINLILKNDFVHYMENARYLLDLKNLPDEAFGIKMVSRPLALVSLMIDYRLWGTNPLGYHLTNVLLHSINVSLVFLLVFLVAGRREISVFSALVFALHPLQSEAVNIASFRADLLVVMFCVLSMLCFIRAFVNTGEKKIGVMVSFFLYAASALFFLLGLFSKETAVVLPLVMLAYVFVFTEGGANRKSVLISGFFLAVSVIFLKFFWMKLFDYSLYRAVFLSIKGNISPLSSFAAYVNTVFLSFFHYLKLVVLPYNLSVDYSIKIYKTLFNLKFFVSVVILGLILAKARKSEDKALKFLVLFALIAYLPVSNLIPLVNTAADRYLYFPLVGISAVLSIVLLNVARSSFRGIPAGVLLMSMLVFLYGFKTVRRNAVYRDMKTLYTDALSKYPDNPRVHLNLAYVFIAQKQWQKAAGELEKTEELNPLYMRSEVWHLKGLACEMLGDYDEAKRNYSKVLRTSPRQDTMRSYAGILMRENKEEDAVRFLKKSVENNPDSDSYNKIGVYYAKKKEYKQAISYFEKAVNTDASSVKAWMNLISTYEAMGMKQAADKKANEMAEVFARNKWKLYGRSKYEE